MAIRARGLSGSSSSPAICEPDEAVVGHVLVEGPDDEVAIVLGVRPVVVLLVAVALGEAGEVEPVPRPALAVVRARPAGGRPAARRRRARGRRRTRRPPRASAAGRSGRTCARRISVRRSAGGLGSIPLASSFARMNRSTGVRHQDASPTGGGSGCVSGRNDQNRRSASVTTARSFLLGEAARRAACRRGPRRRSSRRSSRSASSGSLAALWGMAGFSRWATIR